MFRLEEDSERGGSVIRLIPTLPSFGLDIEAICLQTNLNEKLHFVSLVEYSLVQYSYIEENTISQTLFFPSFALDSNTDYLIISGEMILP